MTSAIVDTFEKLKERNSNSLWLWSMMLTRGLNWDNVWDVFRSGVSTDLQYSGKNSNLVPGVDMLFSLPQGPANVAELFDRMTQIRTHYPHKGTGGYAVWQAKSLNEELLKKAKGHVQCTWPQVRAVLDNSRHSASVEQNEDLRSFVEQYCSDKPSLREKVVLHMVQTQHDFVGSYPFVLLARECEPAIIEKAWTLVQGQVWADPGLAETFLGAFFQRSHRYDIPIEQSLAFIEKHPSIIATMQKHLLSYALHNPKDDAFFLLARPLLQGHPDALIELYSTMNKDLSLAVLNTAKRKSDTGKIEMKPIVQAYLSLPANERDTPEAQNYFANIFQRVSIGMEGYANGHCNKLMAQAVESNPNGVMARILALYACRVGLFPDDCHDDEIKEIKALFRHDPRSKTGHASIIKKFIPDFKEWFSMVQGLGLASNDMWQHGLQKMASNTPDMLMAVDGTVFECAGS